MSLLILFGWHYNESYTLYVMLDNTRQHKKHLIFLTSTKTFTMKDGKNTWQDVVVRRGVAGMMLVEIVRLLRLVPPSTEKTECQYCNCSYYFLRHLSLPDDWRSRVLFLPRHDWSETPESRDWHSPEPTPTRISTSNIIFKILAREPENLKLVEDDIW